jgi:hypothetical protein
VIRDPNVSASIGQLAAIQSAARVSREEVSPLGGLDDKDIERTVTEFARGSNAALIAAASPLINNIAISLSPSQPNIDCRPPIHGVPSSSTVV